MGEREKKDEESVQARKRESVCVHVCVCVRAYVCVSYPEVNNSSTQSVIRFIVHA